MARFVNRSRSAPPISPLHAVPTAKEDLAGGCPDAVATPDHGVSRRDSDLLFCLREDRGLVT